MLHRRKGGREGRTEGAGRTPRIPLVAKPLGDRDVLNICGFTVIVVFTMSITVYYYYFKSGYIELNSGVGSLKRVHSLRRSEVVSRVAVGESV